MSQSSLYKNAHYTARAPFGCLGQSAACPSRSFVTTIVLTACVTILLCSAARAAEDLAALEERAIQAAVDRTAPCVVRIETVGGLERVERVLVGTGPTTGTIVSEDGYIISSAFNFVQKPASILITLPDG